jgi:hypothetical protein
MKSNERVNPSSDYLEFAEAVYRDATARCIADVFDLRDLETMRSRVENEGLSFLTITLPQFAKDFERSLANGHIDPTTFRSFAKVGAIPAFLQGMLGLIFDRDTGRILHEKQPLKSGVASRDIPPLVDSVRQICCAFKKLEVECTPARTYKSLQSFIEIEQSFQEFSLSPQDVDDFRRVTAVLWAPLVSHIRLSDCNPKHGPGATAEHAAGNSKYVWKYWHERLEPFFPIIGNGYPLGLPPDSGELEEVTFIPAELEQPVRVTPVPKTLKGPRIIAIEPCCMQFVQQGIRDQLYKLLESDRLAAGHVNFRDQSVNQRLAIESSVSGQLATIDLSDASDRVPRDLALEMFRFNPDIRDAIEACRSTRAEMPDGTVIGPLGKFASMGSALCFPVEAMYFYTICVLALLKERNLPITFRNCQKVSGELYVYGDDIICPSTNAIAVLDYLQKYNCKVNSAKSFWTGKFRESCGVDAYDGELVTPVYLHHPRPKNGRQCREIVSWTATANLFYKKGYWHTATLMFSILERIIGPMPYVSDTSSALGRKSYLGYESHFQNIGRWNSELHRIEVLAMVPEPVYRVDRLEDYGALSKSLSCVSARDNKSRSGGESESSLSISADRQGRLIYSRSLRLERFALHGAVALKRRWVPAT